MDEPWVEDDKPWDEGMFGREGGAWEEGVGEAIGPRRTMEVGRWGGGLGL